MIDRGRGLHGAAWKGGRHISARRLHCWKSNAEGRGIPWNLSIDALDDLFEKQSGMCALTGLPLRVFSPSRGDRVGGPYLISLDRIDSAKGYEIENVRYLCACVNFMKQGYAEADFIHWCFLIAKNCGATGG